MKHSTPIILLFTFLMVATHVTAQKRTRIFLQDLVQVTGSWEGTLTYLDYSSGQPYTMQANIDISRIGQTGRFVFSNIYPKEPAANSKDTVVLSADGMKIDKEVVKSRKKLPGGEMEIITEEMGKDGNDNKAAIFRHTYLIGKNSFRKKKEVRFLDGKEWILRHEYVYHR